MRTNCVCMILNYNDASTVISLCNKIKDYSCFDAIVVVDNCSTDASYDVLKELESDKILIIQTKHNGGYGFGNNFGIKYIAERLKSKYVLLCNPDVVFENSTVYKMLQVYENRDDVAIVSSVQRDINNKTIQDNAWKIPTPLEYALMGSRIGNHLYKKNIDYLRNDVCEVECVPGACLMLDVEKFLEVGGYDERMFLYCEETVIGIKMKKAGYKTVLATRLFYRHEHSVSINKSIASLKKQKELIYQSRRFVMKEYLNSNRFENYIANFMQTRALRKMK